MYLLIDMETGGLDPQRDALLSIYLAYVDSKGSIVKDLSLNIKSETKNVNKEALEVNGINLEKHNERALSRFEARQEIMRFILGVGKKSVLLGWNTDFDRNFLLALFQEDPTEELFYKLYIDYRIMDVQMLYAYFFKHVRLANACINLHVPLVTTHEAKEDAIATLNVFNKLQEMKEKIQQ